MLSRNAINAGKVDRVAHCEDRNVPVMALPSCLRVRRPSTKAHCVSMSAEVRGQSVQSSLSHR